MAGSTLNFTNSVILFLEQLAKVDTYICYNLDTESLAIYNLICHSASEEISGNSKNTEGNSNSHHTHIRARAYSIIILYIFLITL